jgi:hypothetical protein
MTRHLRHANLWLVVFSVAAALAIDASTALGQDANAMNGMAANGQQQQGQAATANPFAAAGVLVDADGVLRMRVFHDQGGQLTRQRVAAARSSLPPDLSRRSPMRKISLNRLEAAVRAHLDAGKPLGEEIRYLAGLTRLQYVFFYPETNDIVIAGSAEGWTTDLAGRVRGIESFRPVLELEDLVTALRAFPPHGRGATVIGCSIDPTPEGLANMQQFLRTLGGRATPNQTQFIVNGLRQSLGLQEVRITGVPPTTHFAQVLVEADYRMKLIGIGLERPPVRLASYVDLASPTSVSRNALQRWFFVPNYDCVRVTPDQLAMELVGNGVKLVGADELVAADGTRQKSGVVDRASQQFVEGFTAKYPQLAAVSPVFAQLRNLIDMAIAAAFIQQQDYYGKAGWGMDTFGRETAFPVETQTAPQRVESAVNSVWKGNRLMTPIGGGVHIEARQALKPENLLADEEGKVDYARRQTRLDHLAPGQWWWD